MPEVVVFIICILAITICFVMELNASEKKKPEPKEEVVIPAAIQEAFKNFTDTLLAQKGILVNQAKVINWTYLEETVHGAGIFQLYKIDYSVTPETPVGTAQGLILNSKEIFEKLGIRGDLAVLFYKEEERIGEVTFQPAMQITLGGGCRTYVEKRYNALKDWKALPEYSVYLDGISLTLRENIATKTLPEGLVQSRILAEGDLAGIAQYVEILENDHIKVSSLIQFAGRQELIFRIEVKGGGVENRRGIHIGSTVQELKKAYPQELSYEENWQGKGSFYGYIPDDGSDCYMVFKADDGVVSEILLENGFGHRSFSPVQGYVDQDIAWEEVDHEEQLSEKYARELYLGQHKVDLDPEQVVNQFLINDLPGYTIIKRGLLREEEDGKVQIHFAVCKLAGESGLLHAELKLERILIDNYMNDAVIWVVTHRRSQKKEG